MIFAQAKNVSVALGGRRVVSNVDFEINQGELIALIGPNGAGKSTFVKALAGLYPYEGEIKVMGETTQKGQSFCARAISYIAQSREVHWPLTVERVVALGRLPHLQPWQKLSGDDLVIIEAAMRETDVFHLRNRTIDRLAGGERALVLIARGLATQPSLILADEPVAGLDPGHQIQVMELLKARAASASAVLVVLHDLALAARFCDKIYLIHQGKILQSGPARRVLSKDNLEISYGVEALTHEYENEFFVLPWRRK